jgi:hypothetical protein
MRIPWSSFCDICNNVRIFSVLFFVVLHVVTTERRNESCFIDVPQRYSCLVSHYQHFCWKMPSFSTERINQHQKRQMRRVRVGLSKWMSKKRGTHTLFIFYNRAIFLLIKVALMGFIYPHLKVY